MPRGHSPAVVDGQGAHRAVAGQGAAQCGHHAVIGIARANGAAVYRHGIGQRAVHRQFATAHPGAARIAVQAFQHQLAIPRLDQATHVGAASERVLAASECGLLPGMTDVVFELIIGRGIGGQTIEPAFLRFSSGPARLFGSVLYATGANGLIGNRVSPDIAGTAGQRHCHRTEELPRPLHGFLQVGQAPATDHTGHLRRTRRRIVHRLQVVVGAATGQLANRRVLAIRCLQAGGGQQHVPRLAGRHVGEALHHQR